MLERTAPGLVEELKTYLVRHRVAVESMIRPGGPEAGVEAAARYAKAFDGLLCSLFKAAESTMVKAGTWQNVGLAAVGSYGRNELGYHSDLDVRLISASKPEKVRAVAEALLYPLWDAGLSIGHQVVMGSDLLDLAKNDLPTATTLLDWRVLTGDRTSSEKMLIRAFDMGGQYFARQNTGFKPFNNDPVAGKLY